MMTREEIIEAANIMLAYADGKEIQVYNQKKGWSDCNIPAFNWEGYPDSYRIKPTPIYRPFNNAEECWEEMQKHNPFGWVKDIDDGSYTLTICIDKEIIFSTSDIAWTYDSVLENYTFADGTPFGIKEE